MNEHDNHSDEHEVPVKTNRQLCRRSFLRRGTVLGSMPIIATLSAQEARAQESGGS